MFWFIIVTTILSNGDVYTEVLPAKSPEYNNEETCLEVGAVISNQKQIELGTSNGKVYFVCESFTEEIINSATKKKIEL